MPYQIKRDKHGWIINDVEEVLVEDIDSNEEFWIPKGNIGFDKQNNVVFRTTLSLNENENNVTGSTDHLSQSYTAALTEESLHSGESDAITNNDNVIISNEQRINRNMWSHVATLALITAVEARYEDMHQVTTRKSFWSVIANVLETEDFLFSAKACQKKWFNLVRTYKVTKDNKKRSGKAPTRFPYYDRLDEILRNSSTNVNSYSIDIGRVQEQPTTFKANIDSELECDPLSGGEYLINEEKRKRANNPRTNYYKAKKSYYDKKQMYLQKHDESQKEFIKKSLQLKQAKLDLLKKKLKLEERKVIALEKLVQESQN